MKACKLKLGIEIAAECHIESRCVSDILFEYKMVLQHVSETLAIQGGDGWLQQPIEEQWQLIRCSGACTFVGLCGLVAVMLGTGTEETTPQDPVRLTAHRSQRAMWSQLAHA